MLLGEACGYSTNNNRSGNCKIPYDHLVSLQHVMQKKLAFCIVN